jgi:hypothetical protein
MGRIWTVKYLLVVEDIYMPLIWILFKILNGLDVAKIHIKEI